MKEQESIPVKGEPEKVVTNYYTGDTWELVGEDDRTAIYKRRKRDNNK